MSSGAKGGRPGVRPGRAFRIAVAAVLAAGAVALALPGEAGAKDKEELPFPTSKSTILRKQLAVYYIEGTQRIPKNVEISCQKDVHIRGRGKNPVLEVEGSLQVHGVSAREVIFEGVTIRTAQKFEDVHLDMCIFRDGGGVVIPIETPVDGKFFLEHVDFEVGTKLEVTMSGGEIDLSAVSAQKPVRITAVKPPGAKENKVRVNIRGCIDSLAGGLNKGLHVEGAKNVTVRICRMGGDSTVFLDNQNLTFDGCKVNSKLLEFRQSERGAMHKTKILKCDIYSDTVVAFAPEVEGKGETLWMDKCWFKGLTKDKDVHKAVVHDGNDMKGNGVKVRFKKINERPLELAGAIDR